MRARLVFLTTLAVLASTLAAGAEPKELCNPPANGDWIVAVSCTFQGQATAPDNVIVQPGVTLTLAPGADLNIDFGSRHLRVRQNAKVIVKLGAKIR